MLTNITKYMSYMVNWFLYKCIYVITYKSRPIRTYICWLTLRNICHIYYAHVAIYVTYMSKYMSYMINWFLYKCIYGITYKGICTYILTYITKYMSYITHTWQYMSIYVVYMHHICTFRMGVTFELVTFQPVTFEPATLTVSSVSPESIQTDARNHR